MSKYMFQAAHSWQFQVSGATKWQRYNLKVQEHLYKNKLTSHKFGTYEFIFDHEHGNHCERNVITGTECAIRTTPEVVVNDWNVFKEMNDAEINNITKLILKSNWSSVPAITDEDVLVLIPRLEKCKSLWLLDLTGNGLTDVSGFVLGTSLGTNTTLAVVWLDHNRFGRQTGIAIGEAMTTNTSIQILDLWNNNLGANGGAPIIRGLQNNPTLTHFVLGSNLLGDNFGVVVQNDLANINSLETLDLRGNDMGDESGVAIATWLATNPSLKLLLLHNNNFGDLSGVAFGHALTANSTLEKLVLTDNNFGDPSGVAIAKALTSNTSLKNLYLWKNKLGEESEAALVNSLSQNSTLVELDISGNPGFSAATRVKIKFARSPELKALLTNPSVSPSQVPVCVVGFENVGKTELVNTWYRTTAHYFPRFDAEETAPALPDDERDKTSGISIKSFTLPYKREGLWSRTSVNIAAWDFSGHAEYYVSHEVMMQACRDAVFIALIRIDRVHPVAQRKAETERLFFWLKFIATACVNQQRPPTIFIGGSFRPDNDYDVEATTTWTDAVLQNAKDVFGDVLNLQQHNIYHMDCRKHQDPPVVELRNAVAQAAEKTRSLEGRKVPQICDTVRTLLQKVKNEITSKLASHEKATKKKTRQTNGSATMMSWQDTEYAPIMTRSDFEERVLGKLELKAFAIGHQIFRGVRPQSNQLLRIIVSYLHDVGDILWFDTDGLRDVVILTPDLFCSKIIGAIFCPDALGFNGDAVHRDGGLVPKSDIAATFKRVLGISEVHVDAALAILCQLGLSHQHRTTTTGALSFLFPGALAATSYRQPGWFGPLPPG